MELPFPDSYALERFPSIATFNSPSFSTVFCSDNFSLPIPLCLCEEIAFPVALFMEALDTKHEHYYNLVWTDSLNGCLSTSLRVTYIFITRVFVFSNNHLRVALYSQLVQSFDSLLRTAEPNQKNTQHSFVIFASCFPRVKRRGLLGVQR